MKSKLSAAFADAGPCGIDNNLIANLTVADPTVWQLESGSLTPTPLPAALPLFATGVGGLGLLGWRRKRKAQAVAHVTTDSRTRLLLKSRHGDKTHWLCALRILGDAPVFKRRWARHQQKIHCQHAHS
jgi:hypothetical protein